MLPSFTLRPATPADQSAIRNMVIGAWLNPRHLDWQHFVLAVDEAGQLIGCGQLRPHREWTELASLATAEAWRGRGVATAIIHHLQQTHRPTRQPLWLLCAHPLARFYHPFGFAVVDELPPFMANIGRIRRLTHIFHQWKLIKNHMVVMAYHHPE